jgi:hypothetical protein
MSQISAASNGKPAPVALSLIALLCSGRRSSAFGFVMVGSIGSGLGVVGIGVMVAVIVGAGVGVGVGVGVAG